MYEKEELNLLSTFGDVDGSVEPLNAYLGVSFSKFDYFSKHTMHRYMEWAMHRYRRLLVIVADRLETYNKQVFQQMSFEQARQLTLRVGLEKQRAYRKVVPAGYAERIEVVLASELVEGAGCREMLDLVRDRMDISPAFARDLRETVRENLCGVLEAQSDGSLTTDRKLDVLQYYMIEEIAIILYLTCRTEPRYEVSVFNYPPPRLLVEIYSGVHAGLFSEITGRHPYRAIELKLEPVRQGNTW